MLVQFKSDVGGFTMFGDVAQRLLRLAGHSGTVPGAIPAEDMAAALASLRAALDRLAGAEPGEAGSDADADAEPAVPLARRAYPMVELMDRAVAEGCGLHWDQP